MSKGNSLKCVLVIGSGPIVIGQACEFDYSGSQALRALQEEGKEVVLVNSNPATIMTDPEMADHIYLLPLTKESVVHILSKHSIDAVLPTVGGQTALNLAMECHQAGLWEAHQVQLLGVSPETIRLTEDRNAFRNYMAELGLPTCKGIISASFLEGKAAAQEIGMPLVLRPSYTLGGSGGGQVRKAEDFERALRHALEASPIHEVLVEQSIYGWKEFELEILADDKGQLIVVCAMENLDPVGIHTGDSIAVAPTLTLPDTCYQRMRDMAFKIIGQLPGFNGGCNIQYAMHPEDETQLVIIEINPRVSRSSALASKATGYPIAKIAAKLALGYHLDELKNQITGNTSAFFEPSLDYVVVKIPRWNFEKFEGADTQLGLQMKAVGEVMGLGVDFKEALLKACYSLELPVDDFFSSDIAQLNAQEVVARLEHPSWDRLFALFEAFRIGLTAQTIAKHTHIDPWFLSEIASLIDALASLKGQSLESLSVGALQELKAIGFSDNLIGRLLDTNPQEVAKKRHDNQLTLNYRMVDTCAAEFDAQTPYYYSTYQGILNESRPSKHKKVLVLGAGPNRIGQGIEFDYCCVHGLLAAQACGYEALMMNCNPETVSTDFDIADKLYFEPVDEEHVQALIAHEAPTGVIVQLGGQTALKLASYLHKEGIPILGTSYPSLNKAEDRGLFSNLLAEHKIPYPDYGVVTDAQEALTLAQKLGFPLLVRPSYVLGGQHMKIVINQEELETHVVSLFQHLPSNRILLDHFLEGAVEAEVDALCDGEDVHIIGIMQHIEPAGIHSGDSYAVLPPYNLGELVLAKIRKYAKTLALVLQTRGLINIQFAIQGDDVYVIEANPRASRTVPFICKAHQVPYVKYAVEIMLGAKHLSDYRFPTPLKRYAIKEPTFSFNKFPGVNKALGPEMKSTGESIYFIDDLMDSYFTKLYAERNLYLSR